MNKEDWKEVVGSAVFCVLWLACVWLALFL